MTFAAIDTLIKTVSSYAPSLGLALGGPAGGMIGTLISTVFGVGSHDPNELLQKIQTDPEAELKLKTLQYQHGEALDQINAKTIDTEIADTKNGRDINKKLNDQMPNILAILFFGIYGLMQWHILSTHGQEDDVISARVQDILMVIISFYFGSMHKTNGEKK